jgi:chromosome partitioning protein
MPEGLKGIFKDSKQIIVQCKKCNAKYYVNALPKAVLYRCKKCGEPIPVQSGNGKDKKVRRVSGIRVAVVSHKGGSGKTTTTVNLAAVFAEMGKRVLVIDLDPQAAATRWLSDIKYGRELFDFFLGDAGLENIIQSTRFKNIDLIPSSSWLAGVEKELSVKKESLGVLKAGLKKLKADRYHFILMDCPPSRGIMTLNALSAADKIVVPLEAHVLSFNGLSQLINTIDLVKEQFNRDLEIMGIVACRVDLRTRHSRHIVDLLKKRYGDLVYQTAIRENVRVAEAPLFRRPIVQYAPNSHAARDYRALAIEIMRRERRKKEKNR